jgi:hypothetical protein
MITISILWALIICLFIMNPESLNNHRIGSATNSLSPFFMNSRTNSRIFKTIARQKPRFVGSLPFAGSVARRQRPSPSSKAYEACPISNGGWATAT